VPDLQPASSSIAGQLSTWNLNQAGEHFAVDPLVRMVEASAGADARWGLEQKLLGRDIRIAAQTQLETTALAMPFLTPATALQRVFAGSGFTSWLMNWDTVGTAISGMSAGYDARIGDVGGAASTLALWGLEHSPILQIPSANTLTAPNIGTSFYQNTTRGPGYESYTKITTQVTLQPTFLQDATSFLAFPDYAETRVTHLETRTTYFSTPSLTGSFTSLTNVSPSLQTYAPQYQLHTPVYQPVTPFQSYSPGSTGFTRSWQSFAQPQQFYVPPSSNSWR